MSAVLAFPVVLTDLTSVVPSQEASAHSKLGIYLSLGCTAWSSQGWNWSCKYLLVVKYKLNIFYGFLWNICYIHTTTVVLPLGGGGLQAYITFWLCLSLVNYGRHKFRTSTYSSKCQSQGVYFHLLGPSSVHNKNRALSRSLTKIQPKCMQTKQINGRTSSWMPTTSTWKSTHYKPEENVILNTEHMLCVVVVVTCHQFASASSSLPKKVWVI